MAQEIKKQVFVAYSYREYPAAGLMLGGLPAW